MTSADPVRTTVHLVRHGEVHNPDRVLYGRLPGYGLSDLGREMARLAAAHLAERDVVEVVSSPLERAQQTARPIAEAHELPVGTDERLTEAENAFEGRNVAGGKGLLREPRMFKYFLNPTKPSWGEPYVDLARRMRAAIDDARARSRGHESVLVSHQAPIWICRCALEGRRLWHDPRRRECTLASVTSLTYADDHLESIDYAEPAASLLAQAVPGAGA
ncbi:putative phosphoglycerate mutase [Nostocoides japonicum T1-X7]|uniref:Putative phosphoglycerate mutase n=1 Tax=Nostocoides japonicum T1-X7 TaxID=1194083 RepID=A0A077LYR4_9MICO|nr:histidine phosphatase family protein [Tetrasphaera japonica]CCH77109.1 putative phosphoglycerate mutase [Tetrasphaera japonica T1-X7]